MFSKKSPSKREYVRPYAYTSNFATKESSMNNSYNSNLFSPRAKEIEIRSKYFSSKDIDLNSSIERLRKETSKYLIGTRSSPYSPKFDRYSGKKPKDQPQYNITTIPKTEYTRNNDLSTSSRSITDLYKSYLEPSSEETRQKQARKLEIVSRIQDLNTKLSPYKNSYKASDRDYRPYTATSTSMQAMANPGWTGKNREQLEMAAAGNGHLDYRPVSSKDFYL